MRLRHRNRRHVGHGLLQGLLATRYDLSPSIGRDAFPGRASGPVRVWSRWEEIDLNSDFGREQSRPPEPADLGLLRRTAGWITLQTPWPRCSGRVRGPDRDSGARRRPRSARSNTGSARPREPEEVAFPDRALRDERGPALGRLLRPCHLAAPGRPPGLVVGQQGEA